MPAAAALRLPRVSYDELVCGGDPAVWRWLSALHETGATLLTGVPCEPEKVTEVARLVGPVQPQIYGEAWDVVSQEGRSKCSHGTAKVSTVQLVRAV